MSRRPGGSKSRDRIKNKMSPSKERPEESSKQDDSAVRLEEKQSVPKPVNKKGSTNSFGVSPRDPNSAMNQIKPEDWNNIPIPVVDAVKILMTEIDKLQQLNKMNEKKHVQLDQREAQHFAACSREIKSVNQNMNKKVDDLEKYTNTYFKDLEIRMEDFTTNHVIKQIHSYDKKVGEDFSLMKHYLKEYTGQGDRDMEKTITDKLSRDIVNLEKKVTSMFNVEGIVDNLKWESDLQAKRSNQWCNLGTWLKDYSDSIEERFDLVDGQCFKLKNDSDRLATAIQKSNTNFDNVSRNLELINENKKLIGELTGLFGRTEQTEKNAKQTQKEIQGLSFNLSKELQKMEDLTNMNFKKSMEKYDKLKSRIADLYFQVNEEEESELSSDKDSMPLGKKSDTKTKSIDLDKLSQRSLSVQDKKNDALGSNSSKGKMLLSQATMKKKSTHKVQAELKKIKSAIAVDDMDMAEKRENTSESRAPKDDEMQNEQKEPNPVNLEITTSRGAISPKLSQSKSPMTNDKELSKPSKSPKHIKTPGSKKDKDRTPRGIDGNSSFRGKKGKELKSKKTEKDIGADGQNSKGALGAKGKGGVNTNLRLDKIEKYLHDRFDWNGVQAAERAAIKLERSKSPQKKNLPNLINKAQKQKYKYVVDTSEKPQDPGMVNELCMERSNLAQLRNMKAHINPVTVNALEKFTELDQGVFGVNNQMLYGRNSQQVSEPSPKNRSSDGGDRSGSQGRYVYKYDHQSELQTRHRNMQRPQTTNYGDTEMRNYIEITFKEDDFAGQQAKKINRNRVQTSDYKGMSEAERGLYKTLQLDKERNRYTSVEEGGQVSGISQGTGTIDQDSIMRNANHQTIDPAQEKILIQEYQNMNEFAKIQFDSLNVANGAMGLYGGKRVLFQKHGRTILPHDVAMKGAKIGQDPVISDARYALPHANKGHLRMKAGSSSGYTVPTNRSVKTAGVVVGKSGGHSLSSAQSAVRFNAKSREQRGQRFGSVSGATGLNIFSGGQNSKVAKTLQNRMNNNPGGNAFLNKMMTQGQQDPVSSNFGDRAQSLQNDQPMAPYIPTVSSRPQTSTILHQMNVQEQEQRPVSDQAKTETATIQNSPVHQSRKEAENLDLNHAIEIRYDNQEGQQAN